MIPVSGTRLPTVRSKDDLVSLIREIGFLPAFRCGIAGFSAEECIAPEYWFPDKGEGFWEWKGPVIQQSGCAYGKFLSGRAAFMTLDWYREFANYRRDGYDFDARYDEGLARHRDKLVFDILWEKKSLLSKELSRSLAAGEGRKNFYEIMTRLQMQGYVVISNFEYARNKHGEPYGWGITRYEIPEHRFGAEFSGSVYAHAPEESKQILLDRLRMILPGTDEKSILKLIAR